MNASYFQYKYVLMEGDKTVRWEKGFNRIADLDLLKKPEPLQEERTDLVIFDEFDHFKVKFHYHKKLDEYE